MPSVENLITDNLDLWSSAIKTNSGVGRGSSKKRELYGIKKLRELILELAVRGLLVPQEPKDEPAALLLERIAAEKAQMLTDSKIRKQKALPSITDDEIPFELQGGWKWVRLGEISSTVRGVTYKKTDASDVETNDTIPLMRANNIGRGLNFANLVYVPRHLVKPDQLIVEGDILIAMSSGSADLVGKAAQASEELHKTFGAFCGVIRSFSPQLFTYFDFYFQTPLYRKQTRESGKGIGIQNLNQGALSSLLVPIPPAQERASIVAKVDELMALCDQLEQQTESSLTAHQTLVETLLGTLTNAANSEAFDQAWQRIAEHFDTLFTTEHSIDQLKQTILQLAVMGKLVPQDPNDEPVLLNRMFSERKTIVADRRIRGAKPPSPPSSGDVGYALPPTWELCSLGQVTLVTDPNPSHRYPDYSGGTIPLLSTREFSGENGWNPASAKLTTQDFWAFQKGICDFSDGDIVFARKGRLGLPRFLPQFDHFSFSHTVFVIKPMSGVEPTYLLWFLRRKEVITWLTNEMNRNVGVPTLGKAKTERLPIQLPPLAEQKRIVAKVDELMAICDSLKSQININQSTQLYLADSMAERAVA